MVAFTAIVVSPLLAIAPAMASGCLPGAAVRLHRTPTLLRKLPQPSGPALRQGQSALPNQADRGIIAPGTFNCSNQ